MKSLFLTAFSLIIATTSAQAATCYFADGRLAASVQYGQRGVYLHSNFGLVPSGFHAAGPHMSASSADVMAFYNSSTIERATLILEVGQPGSLYIVTREDSSPSFISKSAVVNCSN